MMMMIMMILMMMMSFDDDIDDDDNYLCGLECTHHSAIYIKDVSYISHQQSSIEHSYDAYYSVTYRNSTLSLPDNIHKPLRKFYL